MPHVGVLLLTLVNSQLQVAVNIIYSKWHFVLCLFLPVPCANYSSSLNRLSIIVPMFWNDSSRVPIGFYWRVKWIFSEGGQETALQIIIQKYHRGPRWVLVRKPFLLVIQPSTRVWLVYVLQVTAQLSSGMIFEWSGRISAPASIVSLDNSILYKLILSFYCWIPFLLYLLNSVDSL